MAGWSGPANYTGDTAKISAVLRSWEDRYATRVVGLAGYATLYLSVAAPPRTYQDALHIAAEHFAFCPDNIWQGRHPHTLAVTPTPRGFDHLGILVGLTAPPSEMIN